MDRRLLIAIAAVSAVLGAFFLASGKVGSIGKRQQRYAIDEGGILTDPWEDASRGGMGDHIIPANRFTGPTVDVPVRYPSRTGHELSTLIEQGWEPLYRTRPQILDWITAPPSEESF